MKNEKRGMSQVGLDDICGIKNLTCASVSCRCEAQVFIFDLSSYEHQEISDWNQNMINKMYSVENSLVREDGNNTDSFCISEDCQDDFVVLKSRLTTSWVFISGRSQILEDPAQHKHYDSSSVSRKSEMHFLPFAMITKSF
jgi:hypothetical protein